MAEAAVGTCTTMIDGSTRMLNAYLTSYDVSEDDVTVDSKLQGFIQYSKLTMILYSRRNMIKILRVHADCRSNNNE